MPPEIFEAQKNALSYEIKLGQNRSFVSSIRVVTISNKYLARLKFGKFACKAGWCIIDWRIYHIEQYRLANWQANFLQFAKFIKLSHAIVYSTCLLY